MRDDSRSGRFQNFDWPLFGTIIILCTIGLLTLYSSTYVNQVHIFYKQLVFVGAGITLALVMLFVDYRIFDRFAYPLYGASLFLLVLVQFVGKTVYGSQRWIALGPINIQPSELVKIAVVLVLAKFFSNEKAHLSEGYGFRDLIPVFVLVGIPMALVFVQPDLGTTMMIAFVAFTIVLFCNLKLKALAWMTLGALIIAPLSYQFVLKEYQKDRVRTFMDPTRDPLGEGYHSIQSMIAVGSGELVGKGYKAGTQSKLEFLPKHHTDFIFSAFAEEWGFIGCFAVLAFFFLLVLLGVDVARKSRDKFGSILAMGSLAIIIWHVIVNMGMEIGVLPVVGVPLPFFSYGGSSLLTNMIAFGLLLNVSARKHIF